MKKDRSPADPTPQQPAAGAPAFAHIGDEHWGRGGRYVVDPATGRRQRAPETDESDANPATEE